MKIFAFLQKWSFVIVSYYFLLFALNGLLNLLGMGNIAKLDLLIMLAGTVITISYLRKQITPLDIFIICFIGAIAFIGITKDYDKELWYIGCRGQLYYTIFFFVGRHYKTQNIQIFKKGLWPFLIVCAIGLYLFILSPAWYMNYKLSMWDSAEGISDSRFLEMTRLSAFWVYPYWISYGCAIMYTYILAITYQKGYMNKKNIFILIFIILIALLTQQRAPLAVMAAITTLYIIVGFFKKKKAGHISIKLSIIYFLLFVFGMITVFTTIVEADFFYRFIEKIEALDDLSVFLQERSDIFSNFYTKEITLFGDGIGKYSGSAYRLGKQAITDQQYLLILYETGYWGCLGYGIIILIILAKGIKHLSQNYFELIIISFYLLAMTGSNSLSNFGQHIAIFWICCGRVCNNIYLQYKEKLILN